MRIGYAQDGKAGVAEGGPPLMLWSMASSVSTKPILILSTLCFQFANINLFESFHGVFYRANDCVLLSTIYNYCVQSVYISYLAML